MTDPEIEEKHPSEEHEAELAQGNEQTIEAQARRMGWRPKEEFSGPDDKWRPAAEFVERGLKELPVLRDRFRNLDERYVKDVGDLKNQVKELGDVLAEFREFSTKAEQRSYEKAKRELEAKRETAVAHADTETFRQTQAEIDALEAQAKRPPEKPREAAPTQPQIDPYTFQWVKDNPWFETDARLKAVATAMHVALLTERPNLSLRENLAEVRSEIMQRYPEKFENQRRTQAPTVSESGGPAARRGKGKTFDDLPSDAKAACLKFMKTIKGFTKEEYVKTYFAGVEAE